MAVESHGPVGSQKFHKALQGRTKKPEAIFDEDLDDLDLQARGAIELCLTEEVMSNVMDETTAACMWLKLENHYMTKSLSNKL